jgi:hypothetical protein
VARLEDLYQNFVHLNWQEKLVYVDSYRTRRYNDLNTVQDFDLSKNRKTKSTKVREAKPKREAKAKNDFTPEQIKLLKQLGLC